MPTNVEELTSLSSADLAAAHGGINMKMTQYGYPHDPYSDSETRKGHGAYRNLRNESMAITDAGLRALGLSRAEVRRNEHWVELRLKGGGTLQRRIDDRAPQGEMRADLYQPHGFDKKLPDYADVRLLR
jgi:hypothetical protein